MLRILSCILLRKHEHTAYSALVPLSVDTASDSPVPPQHTVKAQEGVMVNLHAFYTWAW